MTFYNMGWIAKKFEFKKDDWNEFGYYKCPDHIKISLKILSYDNIIVRLDYDKNKLLKVDFNNLYSLSSDLFDSYSNPGLIHKVEENQKRIKKLDEDFED